MRGASETLATLIGGGDRRAVLVTFVRHLIAVAGWFRGASPADLESAIDVVEEVSREALEGYAHEFAWLAYAAGASASGATVS